MSTPQISPKIALPPIRPAGWRQHLTRAEADRIRQLEAIIADQLASLEPLKAERQRLTNRANMRMVRAGRTSKRERTAA